MSPRTRARSRALVALCWGALTACGGDDGSASGTESNSASGTGGTIAAEDVTASDDEGCGDLLSCAGDCVDPQSDVEHCGGCDAPCLSGLACIEGACAIVCGELDLCGGDCVDTQSDAAHCGGCDTPCQSGQPCLSGQCVPVCDDGTITCGVTCVDPSNDEAHCGDCDSPCEAGQPCAFGECVDAAVHHVLITGQSLSVGATSIVVSTEQPYDNVSFNTGVRAGGTNLTAFIPLVETQGGSEGETIASGMANLATELAEAAGYPGRVTLASANGVGGLAYSALAQGTAPYANGLAQVTAGVTVATEQGLTAYVAAVANVHGETDHVTGNVDYEANLLEWQANYQLDVQAITGQTAPVPMFVCQMSSQTAYGSTTSLIPSAQLAASRSAPGRIFVVGPKYFLTYTDGVHISGESERHLGEYYAKAMDQVLVGGQPWVPLSPREVARKGAEIRVAMHVPAPPLVLDEVAVSNPGNYGFTYTDDSGAPPAIASIALEGEDTVVISLDAVPTGGNQRIQYAHVGVGGQPGGPMTGARGNLRDSDATPSRHGYDLANWCVHFDEPVP